MNKLCFIIILFILNYMQAITGFGGPIIVMPLGILLLGVDVAKPAVTVAAWIAAILVAVSYSRSINWKEAAAITGVMLARTILGLWVFENVSMDILLVAYAFLVIAIGMKKLLVENDNSISKVRQYMALGLAGIMHGLFLAGVFVIVYAVEKLKEKNEFRATLSVCWAFLNTFILVYYTFAGCFTWESISISAMLIVPVFLAIWLGSSLVDRINQRNFFRIIYGVVAGSGTILLLDNVI